MMSKAMQDASYREPVRVHPDSNPYQSPLPDEFLEDTVQGYEESLATHQGIINGLRDRVRDLEAENERLKWQMLSLPVAEVVVFGCQMECADIDV